MKQKIITRAIIKQDGKILLVRRSNGHDKLRGKVELPGGSIEFGEQPMDSIRRELREELNVSVETIQLYDSFSHHDTIRGNCQHVVLLYLGSLAPHDKTITLSNEHDKYVWKKLSDIQLEYLTQSAQIAINIYNNSLRKGVNSDEYNNDDDNKTTNNTLIIYSDGGSRGNPGPSAAGFVIMNSKEEVIFEGGKYLDITTNNEAEYQAVFMGLQKAYELDARTIKFRLDSLLVVNQLNGIYQIKNNDLLPIYSQIKDLCTHFNRVTFMHVRREFNMLADGMVNKILDQQINNSHVAVDDMA